MPRRTLLCVASALAAVGLLPACGGGAGGGSLASATSVAKTRVVIDPSTPGDLERLCEETNATILGAIEGTDYTLVEIPKGKKIEEFLKDLEADPRVEDAQPDDDVKFPEGDGTTIPAFVDEDLSGVRAQAAVERIGAHVAQRRGRLGAGAVVAVIDTGIDPTHPAVAGRLWPLGYDFIDMDDDPTDVGDGRDHDRDGLVDEGVGHGTFVASLILAVAPDAQIMVVRALDSDAVGTAAGLARAIAWAAQNGATVINFSGGLTRELRLVGQAIASVEARNVGVVAAAGNRGDGVDFPAALPRVFAVTSIGLDDVRSPFAGAGELVDLCAPGEDLLGAHPRSPTGYARWSGTSFATALVSGGVAVMLGAERVPYGPVVARLMATAVPVDAVNPGDEGRLGAGRVNLDAATAPD